MSKHKPVCILDSKIIRYFTSPAEKWRYCHRILLPIFCIIPSLMQANNSKLQTAHTACDHHQHSRLCAFQYTPFTPYTGSPGRAATFRAFIHKKFCAALNHPRPIQQIASITITQALGLLRLLGLAVLRALTRTVLQRTEN